MSLKTFMNQKCRQRHPIAMQRQYVLHGICLLFNPHLSFETLQPWSWGFEQLSNAIRGWAMALLMQPNT